MTHAAAFGVGHDQVMSVWAPNAERMVHLVSDGVRTPMKREGSGWWQAPEPIRVGSHYAFSLDGGDPRPDPRSLLQSDGPDGASTVVDLTSYEWHDDAWRGANLEGAVFYELHIGTFTPEGTFEAAIDKLDSLVDLGVTHVEVMPVNGVPGHHNWGYDGVNLYATSAAYGGPHEFQRFVDAAHARGLAVCLDVVYNHLGPSGNYLPEFGPYFTDDHATPWGAAVNLDRAGSDTVREFLFDNALMWITQFHIDALRLDAVHALVDDTAIPFLEELAAHVDEVERESGRQVHLIAESDRNDPATVTPRRREPTSDRPDIVVAEGGRSGLGMDAQWADDIHHALHVLLTGETQGYYADFAAPDALAKVLQTPFFHDGTYSSFRGRRHGRPVDPQATPGFRFVASLQTHDQVGNRAAGERLSQLVPFGRLAAGAALLLTSPYVPMLFMGEEWGASTPFQFFTDHTDPAVGEATSAGRAAEFAEHGWGDDVPDPQDPQTFERSKLSWDEWADKASEHAHLRDWYRTLLRLRREIPQLSDSTLGVVEIERDGEGTASVITVRRGPYRVIANLSGTDIEKDGELVAAWHTVSHRDEAVSLPANSAAIIR